MGVKCSLGTAMFLVVSLATTEGVLAVSTGKQCLVVVFALVQCSGVTTCKRRT